MSNTFVEELKTQWLAMIDAVGDPLVLLRSDYTVVRQNKAYFASTTGVETLPLAVGRKCFEVFASRSLPCTHCKLADSFVQNKSQKWTDTAIQNNRIFEIQAFPIDGQMAAVHYRDVTEVRAMSESLARADKLAALGKLAGGVAHEINSPLAGILAFAQMALREMDPEDKFRGDMEQIEDAAQKCKVIVEGMLGFARQDKQQDMGPVDLPSILAATLKLANHMFVKLGIEPRFLAHGDIRVMGIPGKLQQVFMNLFSNAAYAMREGGGILDIRLVDSDAHVSVEVQDSGIGMDNKTLVKVFDPFYTTKPFGEGTGLGMSISYSIIQQHSGAIHVKSELGVGTLVTVVLPKIKFP